MLRTLRTRWLMPLRVWAWAGDGMRSTSLDMASSLIKRCHEMSVMGRPRPPVAPPAVPSGVARSYRVSRPRESGATTELIGNNAKRVPLHFPLPHGGEGQGEGETQHPYEPSPQPSPWKGEDRKSTRLNSSHRTISYAVFC